MISLDFRNPSPIYIQIRDGFKKLILSGTLAENEPLPSVRRLASEMAINPNTIQRAYSELEAEGFTYSIPGKGCFVAEPGGKRSARRAELISRLKDILSELVQLGAAPDELKELIDDCAFGDASNTAGGKADD